MLGRLFTDFGTLDVTRKSNPLGRGLGLSICKLIIERMGGSIRVQNNIEKGTTFILTIKARCDAHNLEESS